LAAVRVRSRSASGRVAPRAPAPACSHRRYRGLRVTSRTRGARAHETFPRRMYGVNHVQSAQRIKHRNRHRTKILCRLQPSVGNFLYSPFVAPPSSPFAPPPDPHRQIACAIQVVTGWEGTGPIGEFERGVRGGRSPLGDAAVLQCFPAQGAGGAALAVGDRPATGMGRGVKARGHPRWGPPGPRLRRRLPRSSAPGAPVPCPIAGLVHMSNAERLRQGHQSGPHRSTATQLNCRPTADTIV